MQAGRRISASLLAVVLTVTVLLAALVLPVSASRKDPFLLGDLNGDGQRTAIDYIMLKRHVLGTYALPETSLPAADINGNGAPDALDYMLLKRALLGTYALPEVAPEPSEPPEELLFAVAFSYLFRTGNHEYLLQLEAQLGMESDDLNRLVLSYLASLSIDGDELLTLEDAITLPSAEEFEAFLRSLAAWLETLLPETP
ncbi:MAG: dockerin type I repeat-containing protein [Oscillospiraceae bacterium]|nr:dockerin type I repeat-containing protein [Oscillospiraceae bacterium]